MSKASAKKALEVLNESGITKPPISVKQIAEAHEIQVVSKALEDETSGFLLNDDDNDQVIICVNRTHHPNRRRFTIAHELGHYFLHSKRDSLFVDNVGYFRNAASAEGTIKRERQANSFAAALLMPAAMLLKDVKDIHGDYILDEDITKLAQRYQVSEQAMILRLVNLGIIDSD